MATFDIEVCKMCSALNLNNRFLSLFDNEDKNKDLRRKFESFSNISVSI